MQNWVKWFLERRIFRFYFYNYKQKEKKIRKIALGSLTDIRSEQKKINMKKIWYNSFEYTYIGSTFDAYLLIGSLASISIWKMSSYMLNFQSCVFGEIGTYLEKRRNKKKHKVRTTLYERIFIFMKD